MTCRGSIGPQQQRHTHGACGEAACSPTTSCRTRRLQCLLQCLDPQLVRDSNSSRILTNHHIVTEQYSNISKNQSIYVEIARRKRNLKVFSADLSDTKNSAGLSFLKSTGFKNPLMDFFFGQNKQKSKKNKNNGNFFRCSYCKTQFDCQ